MSLANLPTDAFAVISSHVRCESLVNLLVVGSRQLNHSLSRTRLHLEIEPRHYGYMDVVAVLYSLQKYFPSTRRVTIIKSLIPDHVLPPKVRRLSPTDLIGLSWGITSLSVVGTNGFAENLMACFIEMGSDNLDAFFPNMTTWSSYAVGRRAANTQKGTVALANTVVPRSCTEISMFQTFNSIYQRNICSEGFVPRGGNAIRYSAIDVSQMRFNTKMLLSAPFEYLQSLSIYINEDLNMSDMPRLLRSLTLCYKTENAGIVNCVFFENVPSQLETLHSKHTHDVVVIRQCLPPTMQVFSARMILDEDHLLHAKTMPKGLRLLNVSQRLLNVTQRLGTLETASRRLEPLPFSDDSSMFITNHLFHGTSLDAEDWIAHWPSALRLVIHKEVPVDWLSKSLSMEGTEGFVFTVTWMYVDRLSTVNGTHRMNVQMACQLLSDPDRDTVFQQYDGCFNMGSSSSVNLQRILTADKLSLLARNATIRCAIIEKVLGSTALPNRKSLRIHRQYLQIACSVIQVEEVMKRQHHLAVWLSCRTGWC